MKSIRKNLLSPLNELDDELFRQIPGIRHAMRLNRRFRLRKNRKNKEE